MVDLSKYTVQQLQQELIRRETIARKRPAKFSKPDFSALIIRCEEYLREVEKGDYVDEDLEHFIFESAMQAVFGDRIFDYMREFQN